MLTLLNMCSITEVAVAAIRALGGSDLREQASKQFAYAGKVHLRGLEKVKLGGLDQLKMVSRRHRCYKVSA